MMRTWIPFVFSFVLPMGTSIVPRFMVFVVRQEGFA